MLNTKLAGDLYRKGHCSNSQLWKRTLAGDRSALSQLFKEFYPPLLNYGLKLIGREDLVKDSIQELFLTVWKKREQLSDATYVNSYLYVSFRRIVLRQNELKQLRQDRDMAYGKESFRQLLNKEQLIISHELKEKRKRQLRKAIHVLTKRQKEAVFLKFQNGLSNQEIAMVMGVNTQSVYNYIHRAIVELQGYLECGAVSNGALQ